MFSNAGVADAEESAAQTALVRRSKPGERREGERREERGREERGERREERGERGEESWCLFLPNTPAATSYSLTLAFSRRVARYVFTTVSLLQCLYYSVCTTVSLLLSSTCELMDDEITRAASLLQCLYYSVFATVSVLLCLYY